MISVESSHIRQFGYAEDAAALFIRFVNGSLYRYSGVPSTVYEGLLSAESKGKAFHRLVKDQYPSEVLELPF